MSTNTRIERSILVLLLDNMRVAGFLPCAVWTEEDYQGADGEISGRASKAVPMTNEQVLKVFEDFDLYAPTVHFTDQHKLTWGCKGVLVVPGNGEDFISDWHCSDKAFDAVANSVCDVAHDGVLVLQS